MLFLCSSGLISFKIDYSDHEITLALISLKLKSKYFIFLHNSRKNVKTFCSKINQIIARVIM